MKRGFSQVGGVPTGMCQSDAAPKRSCTMTAMANFPNHASLHDESMMMMDADFDADYSEHYHAYKQWWLQQEHMQVLASEVLCGAMTAE
jgi:hypothetical protein